MISFICQHTVTNTCWLAIFICYALTTREYLCLCTAQSCRCESVIMTAPSLNHHAQLNALILPRAWQTVP